jgi:hypothetical protein
MVYKIKNNLEIDAIHSLIPHPSGHCNVIESVGAWAKAGIDLYQ